MADAAALPGLEQLNGLVRSVTTPEFAGMTFHEVMCKSALNHVPGASAMPFDWTVNPYRGCSHACSYCFARGTHEYLDLDAGRDFDSQIVVKINVAEVLAKELRRGSWRHDPVMLGTNTDPYQRAEGRYRLMPDIVGGADGFGHAVLDPHEGDAAAAGPSAAAGGRGIRPRVDRDVDRGVRRRAAALASNPERRRRRRVSRPCGRRPRRDSRSRCS